MPRVFVFHIFLFILPCHITNGMHLVLYTVNSPLGGIITIRKCHIKWDKQYNKRKEVIVFKISISQNLVKLKGKMHFLSLYCHFLWILIVFLVNLEVWTSIFFMHRVVGLLSAISLSAPFSLSISLCVSVSLCVCSHFLPHLYPYLPLQMHTQNLSHSLFPGQHNKLESNLRNLRKSRQITIKLKKKAN